MMFPCLKSGNIFLLNFSNHHSDNVFSSMETIMALVLEESEDISPELISTLLSALRRDRQVTIIEG